jgi:exopolyphosphatase/pppGpp-phosphohydrolase
MTAQATRLVLAAHGASLQGTAIGGAAVLPFGPRSLASERFRHDPPTPLELEQAIDVVEDALSATRLPWADRGTLLAADPWVRALPGLETDGAELSRERVEAMFQQLASASLGHPGARAGLPAGGEAAATLLILRECMHHLGFEAVQTVAG